MMNEEKKKLDTTELDISFGLLNEKINKISLVNTSLNRAGILSVVLSVSNITHLDLRGNNLDAKFGCELLSALGNRISEINVCNGLNLRPIKDNKLKELILVPKKSNHSLFCGIEDVGAVILSQHLRNNSSITRFYFKGNNISKQGIQILAQAILLNKKSKIDSINNLSLPFHPVQKSKYESGAVSPYGIYLLQSRRTKERQQLFFTKNHQVNNEDAFFLIEWISKGDNVTHLSLRHANLTVEAYRKLAQYIRKSNVLQVIDLGGSTMCLSSLEILLEALRENRSVVAFIPNIIPVLVSGYYRRKNALLWDFAKLGVSHETVRQIGLSIGDIRERVIEDGSLNIFANKEKILSEEIPLLLRVYALRKVSLKDLEIGVWSNDKRREKEAGRTGEVDHEAGESWYDSSCVDGIKAIRYNPLFLYNIEDCLKELFASKDLVCVKINIPERFVGLLRVIDALSVAINLKKLVLLGMNVGKRTLLTDDPEEDEERFGKKKEEGKAQFIMNYLIENNMTTHMDAYLSFLKQIWGIGKEDSIFMVLFLFYTLKKLPKLEFVNCLSVKNTHDQFMLFYLTSLFLPGVSLHPSLPTQLLPLQRNSSEKNIAGKSSIIRGLSQLYQFSENRASVDSNSDRQFEKGKALCLYLNLPASSSSSYIDEATCEVIVRCLFVLPPSWNISLIPVLPNNRLYDKFSHYFSSLIIHQEANSSPNNIYPTGYQLYSLCHSFHIINLLFPQLDGFTEAVDSKPEKTYKYEFDVLTLPLGYNNTYLEYFAGRIKQYTKLLGVFDCSENDAFFYQNLSNEIIRERHGLVRKIEAFIQTNSVTSGLRRLRKIHFIPSPGNGTPKRTTKQKNNNCETAFWIYVALRCLLPHTESIFIENKAVTLTSAWWKEQHDFDDFLAVLFDMDYDGINRKIPKGYRLYSPMAEVRVCESAPWEAMGTATLLPLLLPISYMPNGGWIKNIRTLNLSMCRIRGVLKETLDRGSYPLLSPHFWCRLSEGGTHFGTKEFGNLMHHTLLQEGITLSPLIKERFFSKLTPDTDKYRFWEYLKLAPKEKLIESSNQGLFFSLWNDFHFPVLEAKNMTCNERFHWRDNMRIGDRCERKLCFELASMNDKPNLLAYESLVWDITLTNVISSFLDNLPNISALDLRGNGFSVADGELISMIIQDYFKQEKLRLYYFNGLPLCNSKPPSKSLRGYKEGTKKTIERNKIISICGYENKTSEAERIGDYLGFNNQRHISTSTNTLHYAVTIDEGDAIIYQLLIQNSIGDVSQVEHLSLFNLQFLTERSLITFFDSFFTLPSKSRGPFTYTIFDLYMPFELKTLLHTQILQHIKQAQKQHLDLNINGLPLHPDAGNASADLLQRRVIMNDVTLVVLDALPTEVAIALKDRTTSFCFKESTDISDLGLLKLKSFMERATTYIHKMNSTLYKSVIEKNCFFSLEQIILSSCPYFSDTGLSVLLQALTQSNELLGKSSSESSSCSLSIFDVRYCPNLTLQSALCINDYILEDRIKVKTLNGISLQTILEEEKDQVAEKNERSVPLICETKKNKGLLLPFYWDATRLYSECDLHVFAHIARRFPWYFSEVVLCSFIPYEKTWSETVNEMLLFKMKSLAQDTGGKYLDIAVEQIRQWKKNAWEQLMFLTDCSTKDLSISTTHDPPFYYQTEQPHTIVRSDKSDRPLISLPPLPLGILRKPYSELNALGIAYCTSLDYHSNVNNASIKDNLYKNCLSFSPYGSSSYLQYSEGAPLTNSSCDYKALVLEKMFTLARWIESTLPVTLSILPSMELWKNPLVSRKFASINVKNINERAEMAFFFDNLLKKLSGNILEGGIVNLKEWNASVLNDSVFDKLEEEILFCNEAKVRLFSKRSRGKRLEWIRDVVSRGATDLNPMQQILYVKKVETLLQLRHKQIKIHREIRKHTKTSYGSVSPTIKKLSLLHQLKLYLSFSSWGKGKLIYKHQKHNLKEIIFGNSPLATKWQRFLEQVVASGKYCANNICQQLNRRVGIKLFEMDPFTFDYPFLERDKEWALPTDHLVHPTSSYQDQLPSTIHSLQVAGVQLKTEDLLYLFGISERVYNITCSNNVSPASLLLPSPNNGVLLYSCFKASQLSYISLQGCHLRDEQGVAILDCIEQTHSPVTCLDLSNNILTDHFAKNLLDRLLGQASPSKLPSTFTKLQALTLRKNYLTSSITYQFFTCAIIKQLVSLDLGYNLIDNYGLDLIWSCLDSEWEKIERGKMSLQFLSLQGNVSISSHRLLHNVIALLYEIPSFILFDASILNVDYRSLILPSHVTIDDESQGVFTATSL